MSQPTIPTNPAEPGEGLSAKSLNWDRLIALLAIVLSITAILVSLFEVNSVRAHSRASVWPHLSVSADFKDTQIAVQVSNKGVGPALIQDAVFMLDGQIVSNLDLAISDTLGSSETTSLMTYDVTDLQNSVIAAGEAINYLTIQNDTGLDRLVSAWSEQGEVEICYCSIHDDCWRTTLVSADTASVSSCAASQQTLSGSSQLSLSGQEFEPITGKLWEGTLTYRDFTSDQQVQIPVEAEIQSVTGRTIVYRLMFPQEPQYNSIERIRISSDGTRIDEQPIITRTRMDDGRLKIVTQGRNTDNSEPADVRMIYEIGVESFAISQQVSPDGTDEYFQRNRYSFRR